MIGYGNSYGTRYRYRYSVANPDPIYILTPDLKTNSDPDPTILGTGYQYFFTEFIFILLFVEGLF